MGGVPGFSGESDHFGGVHPPPQKKMVKVGGLGGGLLRVACSGFYVHLKSVFPLIRFLKRVFRELIYRFR